MKRLVIFLIITIIICSAAYAGYRERYNAFNQISPLPSDVIAQLKMNDNMGDPLLINEVGIPRLIKDAGNPTRPGDDQAWMNSNMVETSDFKINDTEYISWFRCQTIDGGNKIGYSTSTDGVTYTGDVNNPISFTPTISDGNTIFPYVVRDESNFYMFVKDAESDGDIYLFNMTTDHTVPVVMNSGNPVLTFDANAWDDTIYNVGVCIDSSGTWHMLYEGNDAGLARFKLGYAHGTLVGDTIDFTANKSANNPIFDIGSAPYLRYIPDRDAILVMYGESGIWYTSAHRIVTAYTSLSDNLDLVASWKKGTTLINTNPVIESDPHMVDGSTLNGNITFSYNNDQHDVFQAYSPLNLNNFYDRLDNMHGELYPSGNYSNALTITGKIGQAIDFDGSNDYAIIDLGLYDWDDNDFTISIWAKEDAHDGGIQGIFGTRFNNSPADWFSVYTNTSDKLTLDAGVPDHAATVDSTNLSLSGTGWQFIVIAHDVSDTSIKLYRNNVLVGTKQTSGDTLGMAALNEFRLGQRRNSGEGWNGQMDALFIFNKVLLEKEMNYLWNNGRGRESIKGPNFLGSRYSVILKE